MTIPINLQWWHINHAIRQIDSEGVPKIHLSKNNNFIHEGKKYPAKYVILLANNSYSGNDKLDPNTDFTSSQAKSFLEELGFQFEDVERIQFPTINDNLSIEKLAKIYRNIEKGKNEIPPIHFQFECNVIPSVIVGECKDTLVGIIIDKIDFEKRMPEILAHHIRCKHERVIFAGYYWDGPVWEITWKKPFQAAGGEVHRQMYDGKQENLSKTKKVKEIIELEDLPICPFCRTKQEKAPDDIEDFGHMDVCCSQCKNLFVTFLNRESKTYESHRIHL